MNIFEYFMDIWIYPEYPDISRILDISWIPGYFSGIQWIYMAVSRIFPGYNMDMSGYIMDILILQGYLDISWISRYFWNIQKFHRYPDISGIFNGHYLNISEYLMDISRYCTDISGFSWIHSDISWINLNKSHIQSVSW